MGEKIDKSKGKIKVAVGDIIGNDRLVREGQLDVAKGEVKGAVKEIKHAISTATK